MMVTFEEQIAEIRREIAVRERVYPHWVGAGQITKQTADRRLTAMRAVLKTLLDASGERGEPAAVA